MCLLSITLSNNNWGEPERAPHLSYCRAKSSLYIRAICPFISLASNLALRRAPLNAQYANVGPASKGLKVNNIAVKTATFSFTL